MPDLTPEVVIAIVYRCVDRELARQGVKPDDYEPYLQMTEQYNKLAHAAFIRTAQAREHADPETAKALEMQAYNTVLQTAISALMALGHFPYLSRIEDALPGRVGS